MLNSTTMANSDFYTGVFPAEYGNASAGVFDLTLRVGNSQKKEWEAKVGVLGVEIGGEGPLGKGGDASFLFNARYSTGAALVGMDLIQYDWGVLLYGDLSYKLYLPTKKIGTFSVFGLNGRSAIPMKPEIDSSLIEARYDAWFVSQNSFNQIVNIVSGKELKINEKNTLGINLKVFYMGGRPYELMDLDSSLICDNPILLSELGYAGRGNSSLRIDLGLNYRVDNKRTTHEVRLDIYNLSSLMPIGKPVQYWTGYDSYSNSMRVSYYQGVIPFFTYSVKW